MINFLSSYNSDNEDEEEVVKPAAAEGEVAKNGDGKKKDDAEEESDSEQSDTSPIAPNSILMRHQRTIVTSQILVKPQTEPEPLELLPESPEFEQLEKSRDEAEEEGEEKREEEAELEKRGEKSPSQVSAGEKRSVSSRSSSSRSHASSAHEPPEKRPSLEEEILKTEASGHDEEASSLARSMIGKLGDEILLPPEPVAQCPRHLQDRIIELLAYTKRSGLSFVEHAERSKSYRNPSIYEKLVQYCKIDENGTNFPPEIYNPYIWGKESFYEELGKVQRQEMERREKERAQRLPGQSSAIQSAAQGSTMQLGNLDERERKKSKWDTATAGHHPSRPVVQVLTGTAKMIPATGALGPAFSSAGVSKHH